MKVLSLLIQGLIFASPLTMSYHPLEQIVEC